MKLSRFSDILHNVTGDVVRLPSCFQFRVLSSPICMLLVTSCTLIDIGNTMC